MPALPAGRCCGGQNPVVPVGIERTSEAFDAENQLSEASLLRRLQASRSSHRRLPERCCPCSRMLKTIIGILLSRHKDTAEETMTPRLRRNISCYR